MELMAMGKDSRSSLFTGYCYSGSK